MEKQFPKEHVKFSERVLMCIEATGNRLPDPTALFLYLCFIVIALSVWASFSMLSATHPVTQEILQANNLLSPQGINYILKSCVSNYMNFAPLGPVLVAMLGIGLADRSGLLMHLIQYIVTRTPQSGLSYAVVLGGILSNLAADAGYVIYIPLCALIFKASGRHPLAGIAAAFAGVSGGYSANLMIGPVDVIMSGLTQAAGQMVEPELTVSPTNNYYFLVVSTFLISLLGGWITDKWIEPYLNQSPINDTTAASTSVSPSDTAHDQSTDHVKAAEPAKTASVSTSTSDHPAISQRALKRATVGVLIFIGVIFLLKTFYLSQTLASSMLSGLVVLIALGFAIAGYIYGKTNGRFQRSQDWVQAMVDAIASLAGYLVLMFFAAQFVAWFSWTELGPIFAIRGARWVSDMQIPPVMLLLCVTLLTSTLNLFIGSASAKWALLAPVFVPLLMLSDIPPQWTQIAYRIGDSSTNIITPLMPYFALVLAFAQQHDKQLQIGRLMALMLPYSLSFLCSWSLLLVVWYLFGLPLGIN